MAEAALRRIAGANATILLVGGPRDGVWVDDPGTLEFVVHLANKGADVMHPTITTERYRRQQWEDPTVDPVLVVAFYTHDSLKLGEALARLVACYLPKGHT